MLQARVYTEGQTLVLALLVQGGDGIYFAGRYTIWVL